MDTDCGVEKGSLRFANTLEARFKGFVLDAKVIDVLATQYSTTTNTMVMKRNTQTKNIS